MLTHRRGGILTRTGVALALMLGLLAGGTPAVASNTHQPTGYAASDSSSATPRDRGDDAEALVIRKVIDLTKPGVLSEPIPPDYPTGSVYCTSTYRVAGCLEKPTVSFRFAGCVSATTYQFEVTATNPNRSGQVQGWAPVEQAIVENSNPFGDASLVPPATRRGPGRLVWTFILDEGHMTDNAGYAYQNLRFGSAVLDVTC